MLGGYCSIKIKFCIFFCIFFHSQCGAERAAGKTKPPTADTSARAAARDIWGCASAGKSENHARRRESHFSPFRTAAGAKSAQNGRTRTGNTRGRGSPFKSLLGARSEDFHAIMLEKWGNCQPAAQDAPRGFAADDVRNRKISRLRTGGEPGRRLRTPRCGPGGRNLPPFRWRYNFPRQRKPNDDDTHSVPIPPQPAARSGANGRGRGGKLAAAGKTHFRAARRAGPRRSLTWREN